MLNFYFHMPVQQLISAVINITCDRLSDIQEYLNTCFFLFHRKEILTSMFHTVGMNLLLRIFLWKMKKPETSLRLVI